MNNWIKCTLIFSIVVIICNHFIFKFYADPGLTKTDLNELEKQILNHSREMTKMLISLATAIFAAIGYYALTLSKDIDIDPATRLLVVLALCFCALSIDYGYVYLEKWVEMMHLGLFNPFDKIIRLPQLLEIITFLLSLTFSGMMIYRTKLRA